jgi:mono/diheme cytochrome c family protein
MRRARERYDAGDNGSLDVLRVACATACLLLASSGCTDYMIDQHKYETYEPSPLFRDGASARAPVPGTVARGQLRSDSARYTGKTDGRDVQELPYPVTQAIVARGQERFHIYCTPCHGGLGDGNGMIVKRGFAKPPSLHEQRLRDEPVGHFFSVITNGHGAMYSYAARIEPDDRWAIVAYIRALQLSQHATVDDLKALQEPTKEEQSLLQEAGR